ncbi:hypothetical protein Bca101_019142 [Brassica carinata]
MNKSDSPEMNKEKDFIVKKRDAETKKKKNTLKKKRDAAKKSEVVAKKRKLVGGPRQIQPSRLDETWRDRRREMTREKRCVECGYRVKSLLIHYSPGNFRLMKCENCNEVADEYIKCELMIIFMDLILHKTKAYRQCVYSRNCLRSASVVEVGLALSSSRYLYPFLILYRPDIYSTLVLVNVLSANFAFVVSFALIASKITSISASRIEILLGIFISSYIKIFLIAMPVWEFPVSVIFIVDMLVLTSNAVALKVMTESTTSRCLAIAACFMAHCHTRLSSWRIKSLGQGP